METKFVRRLKKIKLERLGFGEGEGKEKRKETYVLVCKVQKEIK